MGFGPWRFKSSPRHHNYLFDFTRFYQNEESKFLCVPQFATHIVTQNVSNRREKCSPLHRTTTSLNAVNLIITDVVFPYCSRLFLLAKNLSRPCKQSTLMMQKNWQITMMITLTNYFTKQNEKKWILTHVEFMALPLKQIAMAQKPLNSLLMILGPLVTQVILLSK